MCTRKLFAVVTASLLAFPALSQEMRTVTDDSGVDVTYPAEPKRVVSLHDSLITIPMLEMGIMPVGSHGRGKSEDSAYIRTAMATTGIDFSNSEIEWVGGHPADLEKIAALEPDLILTTQWQTAEVDKLREIAPTIELHFDTRTDWDTYARVADILGAGEEMDRLERRYQAQIAQIKDIIDTENVMVSTIHGHSKGLYVFNPAGNIGKVLIDAGFQRPAIMETVKEGDKATWFSPEELEKFDGDFIITSYRYGIGDTPETVEGYFEAAVPGYCDLLHACREDQMIMLSMDEVTASSYYALGTVAYAILTAIGGHAYEPMPR